MEKIEKKVLDVYLRINPSVIKIKNRNDWKIFFQKRHNLLKFLSLPYQVFNDNKLLDIGGGTGEKSLYYAQCGAQITLLDANAKSIAFAKKLFSIFHFSLDTIYQPLSEFDFKKIKDFEIVVCEGVLHHTADPKKNLQKILKNLEKDSLFILGISESNGWFKRNLQREFIRKISNYKEDKIVENAKKYFQSHIDRSVKFGLRTENSVIFDSWVNPQIKPMPLKEICKAFHRNKMEYVSSHPTIEPFFDITLHNENRPNYFDYDFYSYYYKFLEKIWVCYEGNHFDMKKDPKKIECEVQRLMKMKTKLKNGKLTGKDFSPWKDSRMGVGINYFVGRKIS